MKVLHVIPSLSTLRGGPTAVVRVLAAQQARAGLEVHVASTDDDDRGRQSVPLATPIWNGGAVYWYFGRNTRTYQSSLGLTTWLLRHTADFDLVHIHSLFTYPATAAAKIAYRRSIPYVVRPLGVLNRFGMASGRAWAKRLSLRLIESGVLRRAAAVQFSSASERAESEEACPLSRGVVIPNPVECAAMVERGRFREAHGIGDRPMILFLARFSPVKGMELLLEAFRIVRRSNPRAVLAMAGSGDEAYVQSLRARAEVLGIAGDVIWTGFLDKVAKAQALADADVFVAPSRSESFGLSAVEALAAGVPAVLTDGVGIALEVGESGAAVVVVPDADAIAGSIDRILNDGCFAGVLAGRARAFVRDRYRPETVAANLFKLYVEVGARA